jgi:uncharacterized membrane protein
MTEGDKAVSHISTKLHMIYISSTNGGHLKLRTSPHFTQLHFISLQYTCRHLTSSHLNFTQLQCTTLSFSLTPFKLSTAPLHLTSLHFTSLHFTPHFYSLHFTSFIITFLTLFLQILGLQGKVPNTSAGSWFKFLMSLNMFNVQDVSAVNIPFHPRSMC